MIRLLNRKDQETVLEYIERNHMETTFLNVNVREFGLENDREKLRCGDYHGYFEGDALKGILPFYNLGSCIPHFETNAAIEPFLAVMKDKKFDVMAGMKKYTGPLYEGLKSVREVLDCSESSYFINRNFQPFSVNEGSFHNIEYQDEAAVDFIVNAYRKGFIQERTPEEVRKMLRDKPREEDFIFLQVNGSIVAQANIQAYTSRINQVGAVFTAEDSRGKGYCKAIVSELCRRIIARGKTPTLSVRKNNIPAVRAYQALGFGFYDDYLIAKFKK